MIHGLLLLAFALPAVAQQAPLEPAKAPERPPLNLKLDNPSRWATVAPEKPGDKDLPALGGDARVAKPAPLGTGRSETGVFPKDSNPGR